MCLPSVYAYESGSCPIFSSITYYSPGLLVDMLYASFSKNTDLYFCIVRNPTPSCFFFTFGSWFLEIPEKPYYDYHDNRCDRKSNDIWPSYATVNPDLSIYLFIYLHIYLSIYIFVYLFIYLFVYSFSKKTDVKKYKFWLFNSSMAKVSFFYYFYELLTLIVKRIWYYIKYAWCDCLCS